MAKLLKKSANNHQAPQSKKTPKTEFNSYQSFRLQKKIKVEDTSSGSFRLFGQALLLLKRNFKLFLGIAAIYAVLYAVLVQGLIALSGLEEAKKLLEERTTGTFAPVAVGFTLFTQVLGFSATLGTTASSYQFFVTLIASLALIWVLRQVYAGRSVRVRDAYYKGMYPLIPFLLVLGVIALGLLPMAIGGALFTSVVHNGIAATGLEVALWSAAFFVLLLVSLYLVTSSLFALYIVSLPDMTPLRALRSASELVRGRRWRVMRRMLFLPLALLLLAGLILIPVILFAIPIVGWVFFVFTVVALAVAHSYMYGLYRSLL